MFQYKTESGWQDCPIPAETSGRMGSAFNLLKEWGYGSSIIITDSFGDQHEIRLTDPGEPDTINI